MAWKNSPRGRLLTIGEESPRLGYARQTIYNAISSGARELPQYPHYRVERNIRIAEEGINACLERRRVVQPANLRWGCFSTIAGKQDIFLKKS